ncbi:hypothetical protein MPTK1_4g02440 [Marchantia polymorpha subsp. ruderalis]|uniref:Uncharacterized protein n=2 Tax=Marchantia polymorpha TaxID=3197 RepID=A0AAF6B5I1_MARPO|nr:hypothetical protein MARPO_0080s0055 [Marchantia polymorpha]BBN07265.1 hypothetical protein Mp_4g02440 [Marchantia polymorpha subsp. ruderalis]|eukprot:PTQ34439.1 hypothetical protein MARPO_0080s0055 [Marchantia polymorpha]
MILWPNDFACWSSRSPERDYSCVCYALTCPAGFPVLYFGTFTSCYILGKVHICPLLEHNCFLLACHVRVPITNFESVEENL